MITVTKQEPLPERAKRIAAELDDQNANLDRKARGVIRELLDTLEALQAEVALYPYAIQKLTAERDSALDENARHKLHIKHIGNDALRTENAELNARLAAIEKQEPVAYLWKNCDGRYSTISETQKKAVNVIGVYTAAGASPQPAQPTPPHECKTEAEKTAFAFGWWKALETVQSSPAREWTTMQMRCIEEGYGVCNEDTYFDARKGRDSTEARNIFTAAHRMGWLAAINAKGPQHDTARRI